MHALVRFAYIAAGDTLTTRDLHEPTAAALDTTTDHYRLASLRYDISKLRAKGLVERIPHSRRYRLLPHGDSMIELDAFPHCRHAMPSRRRRLASQ